MKLGSNCLKAKLMAGSGLHRIWTEPHQAASSRDVIKEVGESWGSNPSKFLFKIRS